MLFEHLTLSPVNVVKMRISRLKLWTAWATELAIEEKAVKSKCSPTVRAVLGTKRVLLMKRIASSIGWPDLALFDEMLVGFRLVGNATQSNVFQPGIKAAVMSEEQVMKDARFMKPALLGKIRAHGSDDHSLELFETTVLEASEKGWLKRPFTPKDMDERFGGKWLPVRRFAVKQKGKLRPIDDLKENRVNDAFTSTEKAVSMLWITWFGFQLFLQGSTSMGAKFLLSSAMGRFCRDMCTRIGLNLHLTSRSQPWI